MRKGKSLVTISKTVNLINGRVKENNNNDQQKKRLKWFCHLHGRNNQTINDTINYDDDD